MTNIPDFTPYFKGTDFGHTDYESIILEGLMKVSCGYSNGYTVEQILKNLQYVRPHYEYNQPNRLTTTDRGDKVMYALYEELKKRAEVQVKNINTFI